MIDKFVKWLKSIGWIKAALLVGGAVLLALAGVRSNRHRRKAANQERLAENILQDHTKKNILKAEELQRSAAKHKKVANDAKADMERQLEKLGTENEDIGDIAARFNGRRVRRSDESDS